MDLGAVYTDAFNNNQNPNLTLMKIPFESVSQIHLAGPTDYGSFLINEKDQKVPPAIWRLLEILAPSIRQLPIAIEREHPTPNMNDLLSDFLKTMNILEAHDATQSNSKRFH